MADLHSIEQVLTPATENTEQVLGIIDLGSNSARLLLVQILPNGAYIVLNRVKHMVRLGENAFQTRHLQEHAMHRTLTVLRAFMGMCRTYKVTQMLPMATAAVRDALNGQDFLTRVREKTGLDMHVISGKEEARLIYLGVSSGLPISHAMRAYMDIGGGSTEIAIAGVNGHESLDSLKLGSVRLTNRFLTKHENQVSDEIFNEMCQYVKVKAVHALSRAKRLAAEELIASSGTALALHNVAFRLEHGTSPSDEHNTLTLEALKKACKHICGLTAAERYALQGVNRRRAQVLVAGAAIMLTLMEELNFTKVTVSNRNLQDGILMDYLRCTSQDAMQNARSVREQSVLQLAMRCHFEEQHARHIANLTLQLHDSAVDCGFIPLDHQGRELLYYSSLLHDIGIFISYAKHATHGAYLINNTEFLGFTDDEIRFMANITQYHNVKPTKKYEDFIQSAVGTSDKQKIFSLLISIAENMDRLHCQHVHEAVFVREKGKVMLNVNSLSASPIEIEAVTSMTKLLTKWLKMEVEIKFNSFVG